MKESDPQQRQRMLFQDNGLLDLVPFGDIESRDRTIVWPLDGGVVMSVVGFREAYRDAVIVSVEGMRVPVVSAVGLMLLKLAAWKERHCAQPRKDAADIAYLINHYETLLTQKILLLRNGWWVTQKALTHPTFSLKEPLNNSM